MKIKLNEIPTEGRSYLITKETGELNTNLKDIIGENDYTVEFYLKPLNKKDFELRGKINTFTDEACSLCGENFKFKVSTKLNEIIIPAEKKDKAQEKQSRSNHFSELDETGPSVLEVKNEVFDLGEYSHQSIALQIPFNPKPEPKEDGSCSVCLRSNMNEIFKYDEDMGIFEKAKEKENPFNVLKGLKQN